ncbi:VOC family protein [Microbacterium sp. zg-YB36]|uniref:VOC family protein n=1 Tax=Microbacterium sp. zg-YB36 TaxID=2969407 RepID=UPI00214BB882|nr:VOC family protein [Microbacterium sp. zg-YB36]MDL5350046.1 VOC family protein [Microbacterium sp. zg-YB36]
MTTHTEERHLNAATSMGAVTLRVSDLESMSGYYANAFAMAPIQERTRGREVHRVLGLGETPLVRLVHTPGLPAADRRQAGLFHTAFLFDDAEGLAATVFRAAQDPRSRFTGSADHLVSEAFYFTDPEGNGVELYTDRDRDLWVHVDGQVQMDSLALDPNEYLRRHLTQDAIDTAPARAGTVGHVHLQVGDVATAQAFYVDALGFEATLTGYPGAIFASAGGYHHHVAMNSWNSRGAGPRAAALGLGDVSITVPDREDLDALIARLRERGLSYDSDGRSVRLTDPWGTQVTVALPDLSPDELLSR